MKVTCENNNEGGIFKAIRDGIQVGEMTYFWENPKTMAIDHTGVAPAARGGGVGRAMVEKAIDYCRENEYKIIPICPFVRTYFQRHQDEKDILATR